MVIAGAPGADEEIDEDAGLGVEELPNAAEVGLEVARLFGVFEDMDSELPLAPTEDCGSWDVVLLFGGGGAFCKMACVAGVKTIVTFCGAERGASGTLEPAGEAADDTDGLGSTSAESKPFVSKFPAGGASGRSVALTIHRGRITPVSGL